MIDTVPVTCSWGTSSTVLRVTGSDRQLTGAEVARPGRRPAPTGETGVRGVPVPASVALPEVGVGVPNPAPALLLLLGGAGSPGLAGATSQGARSYPMLDGPGTAPVAVEVAPPELPGIEARHPSTASSHCVRSSASRESSIGPKLPVITSYLSGGDHARLLAVAPPWKCFVWSICARLSASFRSVRAWQDGQLSPGCWACARRRGCRAIRARARRGGSSFTPATGWERPQAARSPAGAGAPYARPGPRGRSGTRRRSWGGCRWAGAHTEARCCGIRATGSTRRNRTCGEPWRRVRRKGVRPRRRAAPLPLGRAARAAARAHPSGRGRRCQRCPAVPG